MIVNNTTLIKISGNMPNKNILMPKTIIFKFLYLSIFNKDVGLLIKEFLIITSVFHYYLFAYFY